MKDLQAIKEAEKVFWKKYAPYYRFLALSKPYRQLDAVTRSLIKPLPGQIWWDNGCGPGHMAKAIWERSNKKVKYIVATDLFHTLQPQVVSDIPILFRDDCDLSKKLPFADNFFDGMVAGMVRTYIIDYLGKTGIDGFLAATKELYRVMKPGGQIIWSTPVELVNFSKVFLASLGDMLNPMTSFRNKAFMPYIGCKVLGYAKEIARKGNREGWYHFYNRPAHVMTMLEAGFTNIRYYYAFANQDIVLSAFKPVKK